MTQPPASVVIVSRGRAEALKRCLLGVSQLQYDPFEVVVVADPGGIAAARDMPFAGSVKQVPFDEANISAARNLGVTHAAGEIIAFIDDDAVPEPQWLFHLLAPFDHPEVAATGGFVRGRNGISFQWKARGIDPRGETFDLDLSADQAVVLHPPKGQAIKTEGTNMAFRRDVLVDLGGFDPAFRYFLDETDLNMRLAQTGHATAIVPLAEVHHGFAENSLRRSDRVPRDLFDIGASWAVFQRKYLPAVQHADQWARLRADERKRLLRHMVRGSLEPKDVGRLMQRLNDGYAEGSIRAIASTSFPRHPVSGFQGFPARRRPTIVIRSRPIRFAKDYQSAVNRVKKGDIVTVMSLSPSAMFHKVLFTKDGVWLQKGGLFGKSDRDAPLFRLTSRSRRLEKERSRVARQRGLRED
ncbi:glycosyltransferase [Sulfitobacter mediterraneus]|uniref:glycosyltransferase family 2 protein n=1 Tax=Sulfitobacter mediterraneus TaxID=83219 RepID=UPI0019323D81|nr:glycosyltransferase family A protein [Sulfitobacter mediterraneus]MBM1633005.1 glycosyltransferase [Sulfitobacter mediterraneus]MBM1640861.1 glycosyltransferase [Sulfitobacter mediterraneus]MBM1644870.1 glycosyltransferase [Sulfitobacter mediterraneus]MBM1648981.1 glycosyltransferase [Sulfitobacter mediterraneus]MBM1653002.1 glycosyltransferase [Sulfitobacter mediterraneus]